MTRAFTGEAERKAAAFCFALTSIVKTRQPSRKAAMRCAKDIDRAIARTLTCEVPEISFGLITKEQQREDALDVFERMCKACGRCEAHGVERGA